MKMKRYLLFAFRDYYPHGGMEDLYNCYNSIEEIKKGIEMVLTEGDDRYNIHILDIKTMQYTDTYDMLAFYDENEDSILDIDALKIISSGINKFMSPQKSIILITHYQRLLDYIKPDYVHVMQDGKIIKTGSAELAKELETKGYEWLKV
jgi:Fe-S cluster assembly ATPase SufC